MLKNAEVVAELGKLAKKHRGHVTPRHVVEAARPAASPLHSQFEWDDNEAAEKYRLWQARKLLLRVCVEVQMGEERRVVRAFANLTNERKAGLGYSPMVTVLSDDGRRSQLMADALAEMKRFQAKYANLRELTKVFAAMQDVEEKIEARREVLTA